MPDKMFSEFKREATRHITAVTGGVPAHRLASKHAYAFSGKTFQEQLAVWDHIWHTTTSFWVRAHAVFFLERHVKKPESLQQMWPVIVKWQNDVTDWPLCDALAKIYTKILVVAPREVFATLQQWNKDPDLWKRRQSVVSLLYYSRTKKIHLPFKKMEPLVTSLLQDKEYYVQKGVGWTLREWHTVYPKEAFTYLTSHAMNVSAIAFTIAIEKMSDTEKNKLKLLRKSRVRAKGRAQ